VERTAVTVAALTSASYTVADTETSAENLSAFKTATAKTKETGAARIDQSLQRDSKRKLWLLCSGVILVGGAAATIYYCKKKT